MEGTLSDKKPKPSREAYWDELDINGKIERMRQIVKEQERTIQRMTKYLNQLIDHQHLDGKLVRQVDHPNSTSYGEFHLRKGSEEWF